MKELKRPIRSWIKPLPNLTHTVLGIAELGRPPPSLLRWLRHPSAARRPSFWHYLTHVSSAPPPLEGGVYLASFSLGLVGDTKG
jgi:hypothetical protein